MLYDVVYVTNFIQIWLGNFKQKLSHLTLLLKAVAYFCFVDGKRRPFKDVLQITSIVSNQTAAHFSQYCGKKKKQIWIKVKSTPNDYFDIP